MRPAAGIERGCPQGACRLPDKAQKSDFRSYFWALPGPAGTADNPGKPGCRPIFQKNTISILFF